MATNLEKTLSRLQFIEANIGRADDNGYLDKALPMYTAEILIEVAKSLAQISEQLERNAAGA